MTDRAWNEGGNSIKPTSERVPYCSNCKTDAVGVRQIAVTAPMDRAMRSAAPNAMR